ncbi:hypothetical protein ACEWY4_001165 [Coilia grayii]|uniref:Protein Flattop n=1 Tax=Coilia grayii TaxID=363190 RepID=A0ABD1KYR8_9TELE
MSSSFSANQYEGAFKSQKLQNWTVPKHFKERPCAVNGHTTFIATDRGHLLPGLKAKGASAWTSFVGTWDLPNWIPPNHINPTARSQEGQERLRKCGNSRDTTKKVTSLQQAEEAQSTSRTSKAQEEAMTDQLVNQEQPLGAATDHPASPTAAGPPASHRTPEPEQPTSQRNLSPSQKSETHERPVSQKSHINGQPEPSNERPATQQGAEAV